MPSFFSRFDNLEKWEKCFLIIQYKEIKDLLSENLTTLKEQVEEIKGLEEEIEKNQRFINLKMYKELFDSQKFNLASLEKEFFM